MAGESVNLLLTLEKTEPDRDKARRNSTGKPSSQNSYRRASIGSYHDGGNLRRNSIGKPISPNSGQNILPHYLRASTGSCHDFCKYGREHAFEVKARHPIPKRVSTPPSGRQNPIETVVPAEKKKTMVSKLKPSTFSKTPESPEAIKREVSSPSKRVEVFPEHASSNDEKITHNEKKIDLSAKRSHAPSVKPKPVTVKPSSFSEISDDLNGRRNSDIKNRRKAGTSKATVKKVLAPSTASLSPKPSVNRVAILNARKYRSLKLVSPLKDQNRITKAEPKQPDNDKVQEKTLHVVKTQTENKILESAQNGNTNQSSPPPSMLSPKSSSRPNSQEKTLHVVKTETENKILESAQNGNTNQSSPPPSLLSPVSSSRPNSQEKTLHVVKTETENKILESPQNGSTNQPFPSPSLLSPKSSSQPNSPALSFHQEEDLEELEYTDSEADYSSENDEIVNMNDVESSEQNHNRVQRKAGVENKDCAAVKLKFRRGKVVDHQSEDKGPRKLRFRRGRVLGEKQDSKRDAQRRNFKKKEVDDDTNGSNPGSEKVVLRHQDVQGKKDAQGLFNNVIEETASKLVESRKSKVKALVGAFETVISLQDGKPSTQNVTLSGEQSFLP
ncbi:hypothetical protein F0562_005122 [Nyssa sinensis]|uniref:Calmodulin-binding domain-containing protein n=1 Tax=Nyssa sinensis TaxID=561372 RepID=A0A5J5AHB1_9ASTE|nr:hypothetical protein F0562_005122 [Nyssa sinensis]